MSANATARDAWEDEDWESQADKLDTQPTQPAEKKVSSKVTKAQRRAQQAEFNRQLWAEAESPQQTFHYLETRSDVPLKQDFKPTVTLLSRKPQIATRQTPSSSSSATAAGIAQLGLNGEDDESDDEGNKRPEPTPEERQAMALKNREEKQRKYEEARERLFGSPSATTSGASSPGSTTPPLRPHEGRGGKGKGRGGGGGGREREKRDSSTASSKSRHHLYDPASAAKPNAGFTQRQLHRQQSNNSDSDKSSPAPQQPVRNPRGPDASGRGGFSRFANRGGRGS
ncbi:hypothetical protein N7474_006743 [Penicillium riverlandense]|uniref:uncharacterized protein n=1 Tax=Penicillium riverlandense TaxID=1903569 RepID=UPI002547B0ED|nr:uncharacterized protein N7474_006743 [Penicillium riverlandense]KAJ5814966.1 hypothetical protein N7474_006743 [Penicillium riverlandense]